LKFELNGERRGRPANAFDLSAFVNPEQVISGGDVSRPV
jgi:hypothetical protein